MQGPDGCGWYMRRRREESLANPPSREQSILGGKVMVSVEMDGWEIYVKEVRPKGRRAQWGWPRQGVALHYDYVPKDEMTSYLNMVVDLNRKLICRGNPKSRNPKWTASSSTPFWNPFWNSLRSSLMNVTSTREMKMKSLPSKTPLLAVLPLNSDSESWNPMRPTKSMPWSFALMDLVWSLCWNTGVTRYPSSAVLAFPASLLFCFFAFLLLLLLCFSAFLLFLFLCFSAFSAFPASLLFCFSCFFASLLFLLFLLLCFSSFPTSWLAFLLLCFSAVLLFCFSCFFASLLFFFFCFACFSAFLLLCFSCFSLFCFSALLWCILHSIYIPEYHITYLSLENWQRNMWEEVLSFCFGGRRCALPQIPPPAFFVFKPKLVNTLAGVGMMMSWQRNMWEEVLAPPHPLFI